MKKPARDNPKSASALSAAQVQRLLAYVRQRADRARRDGATRAVVDEIIMLILLRGGLRAQELCALRIADTPAHHGRPELHIHGRAGASTRVVFLPQELVAVFQRFVRRHRKGAKPNDPLLLSERGTPFSYMSLYSKVRNIGRESGIAPLHPALLRHTFLVRLYEEQPDLRFVQEQAGHAQVKSTARQVFPRRAAHVCDACGRPVPAGQGERIDSGHLLCPSCLKDIRGR
jgi:integrase/recombinase XerD